MGSSDGALLAREARHRVANDLGVAVAALRLAADGLLDAAAIATAVVRLEAAAEINRVLCVEPEGAMVSLGSSLERLRAPLARIAMAQGWRLRLLVDPMVVDDRDAARVAMIVHELVTNALRHGAGAPGRAVQVAVEDHGGSTVVAVENAGAEGWVRRGGQGGRIVDALAAGMGGRVHRVTAAETGGPCRVDVVLPSLAGAQAPGRSAFPVAPDASIPADMGRAR